ncbi:MAG: hypothetical protein ABH820_03235, partial [Patescibacteria group bacterium]
VISTKAQPRKLSGRSETERSLQKISPLRPVEKWVSGRNDNNTVISTNAERSFSPVISTNTERSFRKDFSTTPAFSEDAGSGRNDREVWIFGNPDYEPDALPLRILPELQKHFLKIDFVIKDPNEDWELPDKLIVLDTVQGIEKVTKFTSLKHFATQSRISMHDFDLGMKLMWLEKLKKLPPFVIIGIPMGASKSEILNDIISELRSL